MVNKKSNWKLSTPGCSNLANFATLYHILIDRFKSMTRKIELIRLKDNKSREEKKILTLWLNLSWKRSAILIWFFPNILILIMKIYNKPKNDVDSIVSKSRLLAAVMKKILRNRIQTLCLAFITISFWIYKVKCGK